LPNSSRNAATENSPQFQLRVIGTKPFQVPEGRQKTTKSVAPLGLKLFCATFPQLKLRAIFKCASGAKRTRSELSKFLPLA
jgi:hypothetical protein